MTITALIILLVIVGLVIGLLPMDPRFTNLLYIVAVILLIMVLVTWLAPGVLHH